MTDGTNNGQVSTANASASGSRAGAPPAAQVLREPEHGASDQTQLASAVRLHPGVIQSTWHTSTDSKTEFDVGEPTDDPNVITTRITTITTTTTVTTFTSPRTGGMLNLARNPSTVPRSGSSPSMALVGLRGHAPHVGGSPVADGLAPSRPPRTVNGNRPRVSFALDPPESDEEGDADKGKGKSIDNDKADGESGAKEPEEAMDDSHKSDEGEAGSQPESNGKEADKGPDDDKEDDADRMAVDEPATSSEKPDSGRKDDGDDENGAAGGSSGQASSSANGNGKSDSQGRVATRRSNRQSSEASGSQASGGANGAKKAGAATEEPASTPEKAGLATRRRATDRIASTDNYSPLLAARVVRKHKENVAAEAAATSGPIASRLGTRSKPESRRAAAVTARRSISSSSTTNEPEAKRPRRESAPAPTPASEETSRLVRTLPRRSTGAVATASAAQPLSSTSSPAVTTRQSARIQDHASATTAEAQNEAKKGGDEGSAKFGVSGLEKVVEVQKEGWRDKVFLTSGIYSDDFRAGKSRKRKRKRANMERRRLAAEKRARIAAAASSKEKEAVAEESDSDESTISSLSELSESEEDNFLPEDTALPLPEHYGFFLLVQDREFRLTYPILVEADEMRARADAKKKPRPYVQIPTNRYVTRPKLAGEVPVCQCVPPPPLTAAEKAALASSAEGGEASGEESAQRFRRGCGDDCINRQLQYVCDPRSCPCKDECSNLSLGKRPFPKLEVYNCGARGFGLRTPIAIKKDQFLGEYRGEVIDLVEASRRTRENYVKDGNYYLLDYDAQAGEVLDAGMKGSIIRFANHSCQPNCYVMKWTICGTDEQLTAEFQIGMYALRDIEAGEELTYDYGWSEFRSKVSAEVTTPIKCLCGAPKCTGILGGKKGSPAELARSGLGTAAKEKAEKALRQQRRRLASASGAAGSSSPSGTASPAPTGVPETSAAAASNPTNAAPAKAPTQQSSAAAGAPSTTTGALVPGRTPSGNASTDHVAGARPSSTAADVSGPSAASQAQAPPRGDKAATKSTIAEQQSQAQGSAAARKGPIRPLPTSSVPAPSSAKGFRPSSVAAAATFNANMIAAIVRQAEESAASPAASASAAAASATASASTRASAGTTGTAPASAATRGGVTAATTASAQPRKSVNGPAAGHKASRTSNGPAGTAASRGASAPGPAGAKAPAAGNAHGQGQGTGATRAASPQEYRRSASGRFASRSSTSSVVAPTATPVQGAQAATPTVASAPVTSNASPSRAIVEVAGPVRPRAVVASTPPASVATQSRSPSTASTPGAQARTQVPLPLPSPSPATPTQTAASSPVAAPVTTVGHPGPVGAAVDLVPGGGSATAPLANKTTTAWSGHAYGAGSGPGANRLSPGSVQAVVAATMAAATNAMSANRSGARPR